MVTDYYSLFDKATESFRAPFAARSEADAVRMVRHGIMKSEALLLHAADLTLMIIGAFDDTTGSFLTVNARVITSLSAIVATLPKEEKNEQA